MEVLTARTTGIRFPLWKALLSLLLAIGLSFAPSAWSQSEPDEEQRQYAQWLLLEGTIGPASADYVEKALQNAAEEGAAFTILQMDTPGGLDPSMRSIIRAMLDSPIPVISYVAPSGARAASAGTYILYASHVAAMAPATNLGAATPVQMGGMPGMPEEEPGGQEDGQSQDDGDNGEQQQAPQPQNAMERKIINDAVAYIEGLAELRGRNAEWARRAVREGASLSSSEALEENVIEIQATDVNDLMSQLDGRQVELDGASITLQTENLDLQRVEPDWRSRLLGIITNPNVAYLLMLIGVYGLIFEFSNPGMGGPGILGVICLMLALYAFQVLPVSYLGLGLIALGVGLMVAEAFAPSFGILGTGGIISFIIGSFVLMDTDLPAYQIALPVVLAVAVASAAILIFVVGMLVRARQTQVVSGVDYMVGQEVPVEQVTNGRALVRVEGELWQVEDGGDLAPGDRVVIRDVRDLTLRVEKQGEE